MNTVLKKCKDCQNAYPLTREFFGQYKNKHNGLVKIGYRNSCRSCMAAVTKKHHKKNPEKLMKRLDKRKKLENNAEGAYVKEDVENIRIEIDDKCFFCNKSLFGKGDIEHLIPLSRGGSNYPHNLTLACQNCNKEKTNKTLFEYLAWRRERGLPIRDIALKYKI